MELFEIIIRHQGDVYRAFRGQHKHAITSHAVNTLRKTCSSNHDVIMTSSHKRVDHASASLWNLHSHFFAASLTTSMTSGMDSCGIWAIVERKAAIISSVLLSSRKRSISKTALRRGLRWFLLFFRRLFLFFLTRCLFFRWNTRCLLVFVAPTTESL